MFLVNSTNLLPRCVDCINTHILASPNISHILPKSHIYWPPPLPVGNSAQSFLKDCLPGCNPQVGSNKIFHFFLRFCWLKFSPTFSSSTSPTIPDHFFSYLNHIHSLAVSLNIISSRKYSLTHLIKSESLFISIYNILFPA